MLTTFVKKGLGGSFLFNTRWASELDNRDAKHFELGWQYRLTDWVSAGASFGRFFAHRRDEDWVKNDASEPWHWSDVDRRGENTLSVWTTLQKKLSFLPGKNWIGRFRIAYDYSLLFSISALNLSPGFSWMWLRKGKRFLSFNFRYEYYKMLNYSKGEVYREGPRLEVMWQANPKVSVGPTVALIKRYWRDTPDFSSRVGSSYEVTEKATAFGLRAVIMLD